MKQVLISIILMLVPMVAIADAVEIEGVYYNLITKSKEAIVTKSPNKNYTGEIEIPQTVIYNGVTYNVNSIETDAFFDCKYLTSISIPPSVTTIGQNAFLNCKGLTSVHISDLEVWCNIDLSGSNPLYYAHHLYLNNEEIRDLVIPQGVTNLYSTFNGCSNLNSVIIPQSVTTMDGAFSDCSALTSIVVPENVTSMNWAFSGCSNLISANIPDGVTSIDGTFFRCSSLTSITIPNSVISINSTFRDCSALTSIVIPNSVTSIGEYAFYGCSSLTSVKIGSSVTDIGRMAFRGCKALLSIIIPNNVISIGEEAFSGCNSIASLTIGNNVKNIYDMAFAYCKEMTDVYCYSKSVPFTYSDVFKDSYIEYTTLHVPASSVNDYKTTAPWNGFKDIVALDGDTPETKKCAKPSISYIDGEIIFNCETEGVEFVSEITAPDAKIYYDGKIKLTNTYQISVYATKDGYENSETATADIITLGNNNGDANCDGVVNAADIVKIVNIIMETQ